MFKKTAEVAVAKVLNREQFKKTAAKNVVAFDPEFVYVVVRAVTANVPNSNHDRFSEEELKRIDSKTRNPVFASFIGNGVYVNHKADDPLTAKGIILDSRFVENSKDDKYVELLLGIDKKKDASFAEGVERGTINRWSMGASVEFTKCSICDHTARRTSEFCNHIKSHKGELLNGKRIYEDCFGVAFTELSAVASPADATALSLAKIAQNRKASDKGEHDGSEDYDEIARKERRNEELKKKKKRSFSQCANCSNGACAGCTGGYCKCDHMETGKAASRKKVAGHNGKTIMQCAKDGCSECRQKVKDAHSPLKFEHEKPKLHEASGKEKSTNTSHGTVIQLAAIRDDLSKGLRSLNSKVEEIMRKKAMPPAMSDPATPAPAVEEDPGLEGTEPGLEGGAEAPEVADTFRALSDFFEGQIEPDQLAEELAAIRDGGAPAEEGFEEGPEEGFGDNSAAGGATDMGGAAAPVGHSPMAGRNSKSFDRFVALLGKKYAKKDNDVKNARKRETKTAEDAGTKVTNQYPYKKVQGDPKQHHTKPFSGRPSSDFEKSKNEYAKMYNISATFVPSADKRLAAWQVNEGETPLFVVTGEGAFEEYLDQQWEHFASRAYGDELIAAICEDGLEETMRHVNATAIPNARVVSAQPRYDEQKLIIAAEEKASDLARQMNEQYKARLLDGIRVAIQLQNKNIIDSPIKAAAFEILNGVVDNPSDVCEKIADAEIVEMHLTAAIDKAAEYLEMDPDAFEEVKAHVEGLPTHKVAMQLEAAGSDEEREEIETEALRLAMRKRASKNSGVNFVSPSESAREGFDDRLRSAVQSGLVTRSIPQNERTYGRPRR